MGTDVDAEPAYEDWLWDHFVNPEGLSFTYSAATWRSIGTKLLRGQVQFSTGRQGRDAYNLGYFLVFVLAYRKRGTTRISVTLDWDAALSVRQAGG